MVRQVASVVLLILVLDDGAKPCLATPDFQTICSSVTNPLSAVFGNFKNNTVQCARTCLDVDACNYLTVRYNSVVDTDCALGVGSTPCTGDTSGGSHWTVFRKTGLMQECHCTNGSVAFGTSCYTFPPGIFSWDTGEAYCTSIGANMTEIEDLWENAFLVQEGLSRGYNKLWLGGTDRDVEGTWRWLSGGLIMQHWSPREPNNSGNEDYLELYLVSTRWNDHKMTIENPLVCETSCL